MLSDEMIVRLSGLLIQHVFGYVVSDDVRDRMLEYKQRLILWMVKRGDGPVPEPNRPPPGCQAQWRLYRKIAREIAVHRIPA